jgi:uncharacterized protein YwgA
MNRNDFVLAVFASSNNASYSPVQIQKLFFLIEKKIPELSENNYFNFTPYNYGPFDPVIYDVISELISSGNLKTINDADSRIIKYNTTNKGQIRGEQILQSLGVNAAGKIKILSDFVRRLSFSELVSAIYKEYPDMKKYSIFRG